MQNEPKTNPKLSFQNRFLGDVEADFAGASRSPALSARGLFPGPKDRGSSAGLGKAPTTEILRGLRPLGMTSSCDFDATVRDCALDFAIIRMYS